MLSFCVSVRWSNSGVALRSSRACGSFVGSSLGTLAGGGVGAGVLASTGGSETEPSSVGSCVVVVGGAYVGGCTGCCVVAGGCVGLVFALGVLVLVAVGVGVTVWVTVVSGFSGVGVPSVVVTVTVTSGSQASPASQPSIGGSNPATAALALCTTNGETAAPVRPMARTSADTAVARLRATGALLAVPEPWSREY